MLSDDEYILKLNRIEHEIKSLEEQQRKINNKLRILKSTKEELQNEHHRQKIRNRPQETEEWVENKFEWSEKIQKLLTEKFKFKEFRSRQLAAINATLSKKDVLLVMPTGGGKSLVYQLPALINKNLTLVVSPLISLIEDQLIALKKFDITAATVNGSSSKEEKKNVHNDMQNNKINLLYVTPEWIAKSKIFMTYLQKVYGKGHLDRVVIDEVHCCSTWGHDFRPEYNHLGFFKSMFPDIPILGLTATATMNVLVDIQNMLSIKDALIITAPYNRANLFYKVLQKPQDKNDCLDYLEKLLKTKYQNKSGIIYSGTIKECEEISDGLRNRGLKVKQYHTQLENAAKKIIHQRWLENKYQAVVATIAFGMGIDKPDVRFVIHHSIPKSMEGLYQESGRAGRDGKPADCLLMFNLNDFLRNVSMASSKTEEKNAKLILAYCLDLKRCRRSLIAEHFEDTWNQSDCEKMCDHCKYPKELANYDISSGYKDIHNIIEYASEKETKVTLNKLMAAWFMSGSKEIRPSSIKKPICTKDQAEHIVGYLIFRGFLHIDKGYTMYTTVAYLQNASSFRNEKVIMPYMNSLKGFVLTEESQSKDEELGEPSRKKVKL